MTSKSKLVPVKTPPEIRILVEASGKNGARRAPSEAEIVQLTPRCGVPPWLLGGSRPYCTTKSIMREAWRLLEDTGRHARRAN